MKVRIVNRSGHPNPTYATKYSAGMDLRANVKNPVTLRPFERTIVPTGLYIEIPTGYEGQIRPRSGLALKNGVTVLNSPGTIDSDYRGEVKVLLINLSHEITEIENGDRIAQLVIAPYSKVDWEKSDSLSETGRGEGGYGHTGKN
jgi:dUTP pyrophosphatase